MGRTADQLVTKVRSIVQDSSYSCAEVLDRLNISQREIAGGIVLDGGLPMTPPLPELATYTSVSVTSALSYADMPSTFQRKLFFVVDVNGDKVKVWDSWVRFLQRFPGLDDTAGISHVCLVGRALYYQGRPSSATTVLCHFHRYPVDMSATASPDGIPDHLQERLLVSRTCEGMYDEIEDGIDGKKTNTENQRSKFRTAVYELIRFVGPEDSEPSFVSDDEDHII